MIMNRKNWILGPLFLACFAVGIVASVKPKTASAQSCYCKGCFSWGGSLSYCSPCYGLGEGCKWIDYPGGRYCLSEAPINPGCLDFPPRPRPRP
jgi:hypothetical protein